MQTRKQLKLRAKKILKTNYQRMVSVCFLAALLTTTFASSTLILRQFRPGLQTAFIQTHHNFSDASSSDIAADTIHHLFQIHVSDTPVANILEHIFDLYTSGKSVIFSILRAVNELFHNPLSLPFFFFLLGIALSALYAIFIQNVLLIGEARFFLETRTYQRTMTGKIFFLYKLNYFIRPALIMTCRAIFQGLWNLTIIGGVIKKYEYSLIPFLLAENPTLQRKEAFLLSRRMMHGNKWRLFCLHLSFWGWSLLSLLTFGILDFLFVNPYRMAADTEFYMELRKNYIRSRNLHYELLNDPLLEQELSDDELLIRKALYDDSEGPYTKIAYFEPRQYPVFLYSVQPPKPAVPASASTEGSLFRSPPDFSVFPLFHIRMDVGNPELSDTGRHIPQSKYPVRPLDSFVWNLWRSQRNIIEKIYFQSNRYVSPERIVILRNRLFFRLYDTADLAFRFLEMV